MKTITLFVESRMSLSNSKQKYETAKTYRTLLRHLERFSGNPNLQFSDLTPDFLLTFQRHLADNGCGNNTRLLYFHHLQALHRKAAAQGLALDPADLYNTVLTRPNETVKRCIAAVILRKVRDTPLPPEYSYLAFARDMFILSFYLRGIPFVDLAHLRRTDLKGNTLRYGRHKTGKTLVVTLEPRALQIVERWRNRTGNSPYLFPIIKHPGNAKDEHRQYGSALRLYNKHLKKIPSVVGLKEDTRLTSYTPRHTWANLAHKDGVEMPLISEALSHSSEKTTRHYIESFKVDALDAVNRRVIRIVDGHGFKEDKEEKRERKNRLRQVPVI